MNEEAFLALMPGQAKLLELVVELQNLVAKWMADRPRSYAPCLFVVTREGMESKEIRELYSLACVPFNEEEEKFALMRAIGQSFHERRVFPLVAILASEAWASTQSPDEPRRQPRDDPERQEVLLISSLTINRLYASCVAPVSRDADERMTLGTWGEISTTGNARLLQQLYQGFMQKIRANCN